MDIKNIKIPDQDGKWLVIVLKELELTVLISTLRNLFDVVDYTVDYSKIKSNRDLYSDYFLFVNSCVDAKGFENLNGGYLDKHTPHNGMTLKERLLLELYYYETKNELLDANYMETLCVESEFTSGWGYTPCVHSEDWVLYISGVYSGVAGKSEYISSREVFDVTLINVKN